jgi:hypothetical protein
MARRVCRGGELWSWEVAGKGQLRESAANLGDRVPG